MTAPQVPVSEVGPDAQPSAVRSWQFPLPWPPVARRRGLLAGLAAGCGAVFLLLAVLVNAGWETGFRLDVRIASWADGMVQDNEVYREVVSMVTHLGDTLSVLVFAGFATLALLGHRMWRSFWFLFTALGAGFLGVTLMKYAVERPRPPSDFGALESSPSFPSGHTAGSALLWLALLLIVLPWEPRTRWPWLSFFAVGMLSIVAASRVLLAAHYLSDVMASLFWSVAWVSVALLLVRPWKEVDDIRERQGQGQVQSQSP